MEKKAYSTKKEKTIDFIIGLIIGIIIAVSITVGVAFVLSMESVSNMIAPPGMLGRGSIIAINLPLYWIFGSVILTTVGFVIAGIILMKRRFMVLGLLFSVIMVPSALFGTCYMAQFLR